MFVLRNDYEVGRWSWKSLLSRMQELRPSDFDSLVSIAETSLTKALELCPSLEKQVDGFLGLIYAATGNLEEAELSLGKAVAAGTKDISVHEKLAEVHFEMGNLDAALVDAKKALNLNPDGITALTVIASCYSHMNRGKEALRALRRVVGLDPGNAAAYALMGQVQIKENRTEDA